MEDDVLREISKNLNDSISNKGNLINLSYEDYEPVEINEKNFHNIERDIKNRKIVFIDGGNSEILKSSNFSLQLIRVYYQKVF
jgi:hypothetical protein